MAGAKPPTRACRCCRAGQPRSGPRGEWIDQRPEPLILSGTSRRASQSHPSRCRLLAPGSHRAACPERCFDRNPGNQRMGVDVVSSASFLIPSIAIVARFLRKRKIDRWRRAGGYLCEPARSGGHFGRPPAARTRARGLGFGKPLSRAFRGCAGRATRRYRPGVGRASPRDESRGASVDVPHRPGPRAGRRGALPRTNWVPKVPLMGPIR